MKIPGQMGAGVAGTVGARLGVPQGAGAVELPAIYTAEPGDARPSILLIGDSGTGKTEQLKRLIAHLNRNNLATLVLSIEGKHQVLQGLRPNIQSIYGPVVDKATGAKRAPTATEKYQRLLLFRDRLRDGGFREHNGRPIACLVGDGLMELGNVVKTHRMQPGVIPVDRDGSQNTWAAFDKIGLDILDFVASLKEAASDAGKALGIEPMTIAMTCGESLHKTGKFVPILPGNQAPDLLAYQFELMLRLATESVDGVTQYVAHTVNGESGYPVMGRWNAKAPGGLFEPKIVNPDLGAIYARLIAHYRGETVGATDGAV